jgi:nucleoid-associated protein YgaU
VAAAQAALREAIRQQPPWQASPRVEEGSATTAAPPEREATRRPFADRERSKVSAGTTLLRAARAPAPTRRCPRAGKWVKVPGMYTVRRGDTLWAISERFYDDGQLYGRIFRANRGRIEDPDRIEICQQIWLPARRG